MGAPGCSQSRFKARRKGFRLKRSAHARMASASRERQMRSCSNHSRACTNDSTLCSGNSNPVGSGIPAAAQTHRVQQTAPPKPNHRSSGRHCFHRSNAEVFQTCIHKGSTTGHELFHLLLGLMAEQGDRGPARASNRALSGPSPTTSEVDPSG